MNWSAVAGVILVILIVVGLSACVQVQVAMRDTIKNGEIKGAEITSQPPQAANESEPASRPQTQNKAEGKDHRVPNDGVPPVLPGRGVK